MSFINEFSLANIMLVSELSKPLGDIPKVDDSLINVIHEPRPEANKHRFKIDIVNNKELSEDNLEIMANSLLPYTLNNEGKGPQQIGANFQWTLMGDDLFDLAMDKLDIGLLTVGEDSDISFLSYQLHEVLNENLGVFTQLLPASINDKFALVLDFNYSTRPNIPEAQQEVITSFIKLKKRSEKISNQLFSKVTGD